jgi:hypothetical protein
MPINNDLNPGAVATPDKYYYKQQAGGTPPRRRSKGRGRLYTILSTLLLVMLILAAVRVTSVASGNTDELVLKVGSQQQALIDLRQGLPISPYLFGVNVFPKDQTQDALNQFSGFMSYGPQVVPYLKQAGIKLLRFPGGSWGEDKPLQNHVLSYEQLYDFSTLLYQLSSPQLPTGAEGMVQARLSCPLDNKNSGLQNCLAQRANLAGSWVDFMSNPKSSLRTCPSNPKSSLRTCPFANVQIHPIKFWSVGNEPDQLIDPATSQQYTVKDYVKDFIAYSIAMHQNNPAIEVFGPELSQFYGVGVGPKDSERTLWMEGFLKGVADYEQAHPEYSCSCPKFQFHLLDGVSFHFYPFTDASINPNLLMSSPDELNYLLPPLRQLIRQTLGRDVPIAITEINTNTTAQVPTRGQAALWWADTLGTLMNQEVEFAGFFSAEGVDQPYPLFTSDNSHQQTAMFRVMQLFSHLQHNLIPLQVQHDPFSVYATQDDAHNTVSLLFINKSGGNQFAEVSAQNQIFGTSPWHTQDISIAAYSMVLVTLHRNGGAEAYSFTAPAVTDAAIESLNYTGCGNKVDALAYNVPC